MIYSKNNFYKMFTETINEKVSKDCSDGSGVIPDGPYKGWKVIRTRHLDEPRPPSEKERDDGFLCDTFENLVLAFLKKRLNIQDGKYLLEWKNNKEGGLSARKVKCKSAGVA